MTVFFQLGDLQLPSAHAVIARNICEENALSAHQLYCKWEAWALANDKSTNLPSEQDLHSLAAHIRSKSRSKPSDTRAKFSPSSNRLVRTPTPTPTRIDINDFFNYFDEPVGEQPCDEPLSVARNLQHDLAELPDRPQPKRSRMDIPPEHTAAQSQPDPATSSKMLLDHLPPLPGDDTPDATYANRQASGRVEATFNNDHTTPHNHMPRSERGPLDVTSYPDTKRTEFRYMNDTVSQRILAVRDRLRTVGDRILQRIKQSRADEMPPVSTSGFTEGSPTRILLVGRIRTELDEIDSKHGSHINANSVLLESEDGHRIKLDLGRMLSNKLPFFLAPGMIAVVEGVNTNGRLLDVHAIYDNAMQTAQHRHQPKLDTDHQVDTDDKMDVHSSQHVHSQPYARTMIASGPFSCSTNLRYEPLTDLLDIVKREKPDLVMLTGPFVEQSHPHISEKTPLPFEQVFVHRVFALVANTLSEMRQQHENLPHFVLIPALEDVHHSFVCPQPPFNWPNDQPLDPNIQLCSNPCVLKVSTKDERFSSFIGSSSLSTLLDISADSLCANKGDRLGAIVSHMLRQKSFYPKFPPASSVPMDTTFLEQLDICDVETGATVDLFVVPSKLKSFAKSVDGGAIAVNPGISCRGSTGGTYAEVALPLHASGRHRTLQDNEDKMEVSVVRL